MYMCVHGYMSICVCVHVCVWIIGVRKFVLEKSLINVINTLSTFVLHLK